MGLNLINIFQPDVLLSLMISVLAFWNLYLQRRLIEFQHETNEELDRMNDDILYLEKGQYKEQQED
jgi:hypothetical protein